MPRELLATFDWARVSAADRVASWSDALIIT
jgi:hypothetical protein